MANRTSTASVSNTVGVLSSVPSQKYYADPLYLHHSDSSNIVLVSCVLTGSENYEIWSRAMSFALSGKNKLDFVEGLVPLPNDPDLAGEWHRCDAVVMCWILNCVDKNIFSHLVFCTKASDAWSNLRLMFRKPYGIRLYSILHELSNTTQGNDTVAEYYMKLKSLWVQYASVSPSSRCVCAASHDLLRYESNLRLMQFLMGLNEKYYTLSFIILRSDPLPDVMDAFAMVSREESARVIDAGNTSDKTLSAVVSEKKFVKSRVKNPNLKCSHCGGSGHLVERCYKLIGYPEKRCFPKNENAGESANIVRETSSSNVVEPSNNTPDSSELIEQLLRMANVCKDDHSHKVNMAGI
ncbi:uncharacterized protein LOC127249912 isoform X2 [Andrographis paniculata]|uniref:uncharacterized protein LOC127249912 isoform X2 n=1 Tax=Andrographis paniculata TaxID=175694 RepID=UPI0021E81F43|nr:uncharacterized protein LOC127249912 isoform X2 [Andrographis paniculata]